MGERPSPDAGARPTGCNVRICGRLGVVGAAQRGLGVYNVYMGGAVLHCYKASRTDFADVVECGRRWCEAHGYTVVSVTRPLTTVQLADLPEKWENPTVDVRKYTQVCTEVWETDAQTYRLTRDQGGLCQTYQGKFYIGR